MSTVRDNLKKIYWASAREILTENGPPRSHPLAEPMNAAYRRWNDLSLQEVIEVLHGVDDLRQARGLRGIDFTLVDRVLLDGKQVTDLKTF